MIIIIIMIMIMIMRIIIIMILIIIEPITHRVLACLDVHKLRGSRNAH